MNKISVHAKAKEQTAESCILVIFGAAGDLTKRLLIPSLCNLGESGFLPKSFHVVAIARQDMDTEQYRKHVGNAISKYASCADSQTFSQTLLGQVSYLFGDINQTECYQSLKCYLEQLSSESGIRNYLFYLATPPQLFSRIAKGLKDVSLTEEADTYWRRIIIEKPFGSNLESAKQLNADLAKVLSESQTYRIDHYLGKEPVQNLLVFRFANSLFEPLWHRDHIDHVQISVNESIGVENRGNFYDPVGALRDMVPNHLFQLLAYVAMEPPRSLDADCIRDEKVKLMRAILPIDTESIPTRCVRGQYDCGMINGKFVRAYREEDHIAKESTTETFVALKLMIENERWLGVPFYLRTGKRMPVRSTEIVIQFKENSSLFQSSLNKIEQTPNALIIRIQPNAGIFLRFRVKAPGPMLNIADTYLKFHFADDFKTVAKTGYENLLFDAMKGDRTLFQRADMVEHSWSIVEPILQFFDSKDPQPIPLYESGTFGPKEAHELINRDGRSWYTMEFTP